MSWGRSLFCGTRPEMLIVTTLTCAHARQTLPRVNVSARTVSSGRGSAAAAAAAAVGLLDVATLGSDRASACLAADAQALR